jgi:hypothetical protein
MQVPHMLMGSPGSVVERRHLALQLEITGQPGRATASSAEGPEVPLHGFGRTVTPSDASTGPGYRAGTLVHDVGGQAHGAKIRLPHATATMKAD